MKKLFLLGSLMLLSIISCQNDNEDMSSKNGTSSKMTTNRGQEDNPKLELKYVSPSEVYFKGDRLVEEKGAYAEIVANTILHPETSRRASVQCSFTDGEGTTVVLTQVSGDGQSSTYWVSYVHTDGSISTYPNTVGGCSFFAYWTGTGSN